MIKYILAFCLLATSALAVSSVGGWGGRAGTESIHVFSVMDYGAVHDGTTDDTAHINAAIAAAYNSGGGTVYLPKGHYKLSGAFNSTTNSILTCPVNMSYAGFVPRVEIRGEATGVTGANNDTYEGGVLLDATSAPTGSGSYPSVFAAAPYSEIVDFTFDGSLWSRVDPLISDLTIWLPDNPTFGGINLHNCMQGGVGDNVRIGVKTPGGSLYTQPSHSAAVGIILPAHLNNVSHIGIGRNCTVFGVYDGIWTGEHSTLEKPQVGGCVNGLRIRMMAHPTVGNISIEACNRMIVVDDNAHNCPVELVVQGEIFGAGDWREGSSSGAFLYDPNNTLYGFISYEILSTPLGGFVSTLTSAEATGCAHVHTTNLLSDAANSPFPLPVTGKFNLADTSDSSGNGHTLTNNGSVTFTSGKIGNAATFNGSNYLSAAFHPAQGSYTVCFWVKFVDSGSTESLVAEQGLGALRFASYKLSDRTIYCEFYDTANNVVTPTSSAQTAGAWHFVVLQFNNSTKVARTKIDNGSWNTAAALPNTISTTNTPTFTIGAELSPSTGVAGAFLPTGSQIDAISCHSVILQDSEITALYNGGSGRE